MIKGIGIDLIELDRIKKSLEKSERLVTRILTDDEQKLFRMFKSDKRKIEFLAGRFAAKEAFSKAIGEGIGKLSFQDIEILPNSNGAPVIKVRGFESYRIFISISHSHHYAVAQIVIEDK